MTDFYLHTDSINRLKSIISVDKSIPKIDLAAHALPWRRLHPFASHCPTTMD